MVEGIIAGAAIVALILGFWLTRNAKGPGGLPGMAAKNALLDEQLRSVQQDEAFEDGSSR